jgi:hypothetical protein
MYALIFLSDLAIIQTIKEYSYSDMLTQISDIFILEIQGQ